MIKRLNLNDREGHVLVEDPPIAQALFASTKWAWIWVPLRLWLGYQWIEGAEHKITDPAWMQSGAAIKAFWTRALAVNPQTGKDLITFGWYRDFLNLLVSTNSQVWFGKLIAVGELLVGLGLIFGALVGVAASFGGLMNWSFLMAGTVSTNPLLFAVTGLIILAWKTAGYYGLDRYLLPALGTPWKQHEPAAKPETVEPRGTGRTAPLGAR
jgi:thiosulfate dehydrogenase (quinone) large subunit